MTTIHIPVVDQETIAYVLTGWLQSVNDQKIKTNLSFEDNVACMYEWLDKPINVIQYLKNCKYAHPEAYKDIDVLIDAINTMREGEFYNVPIAATIS